MALLSAWLISSGAYGWGYALLAALGAFALTAAGMAAHSRAKYYEAVTPKPPQAPRPEPIPVVIPIHYTDDEIKDELLPALSKMAGILERRCQRTVATWEEIYGRYWNERGTLNRLRGQEAWALANELKESRDLIYKAYKELHQAAAGTYQGELLPLADVPGPLLRDADHKIGVIVAKLDEFSKPTADQVDCGPVFIDDGRVLRQLTKRYGEWLQDARLRVGNRNYALRQVLDERAGAKTEQN